MKSISCCMRLLGWWEFFLTNTWDMIYFMTIEWKCVASLKYNRRQTCLEANPNFHKCYSPHHDSEDAADVEIKF